MQDMPLNALFERARSIYEDAEAEQSKVIGRVAPVLPLRDSASHHVRPMIMSSWKSNQS